ncbi:hypothetical protein PsorP6_018003 [Peronosclerospora sorghi]|uniref:Uncharacterized protein n=1 Tax=Peronosclerospora sorghi TaxID=230839 RepID=A0ACC0WBD9_9STRA|nr:hypothetical protein PsorP6_018003 [Peronosclerospora sorghi]
MGRGRSGPQGRRGRELTRLGELVKVGRDLPHERLVLGAALLRVMGLELRQHVVKVGPAPRGNIRRLHRAERRPVHAVKPRMALDLVHGPGAESVLGITNQSLHKIPARRTQSRRGFGREPKRLVPVDNLATRLHGLIGVKGWVPDQTLVQDDAHGPPVTLLPISFLCQHLGRNVVGRAHRAKRNLSVATKRFAPRRVHTVCRAATFDGRGTLCIHGMVRNREQIHARVHFLAQPQVRELQVPMRVQEHIVGFHVAMNVAELVHGLNGKHHLRRIKARRGFIEGILFHQESHEIAAG